MYDIFAKVKAGVGIAEVVTRFGVKLNRSDQGLCPFHQEKTGSFSVKRSDNIYTCFGCGATGDAIDFVSRLKNIEPLEAAKMLAEMYHIDIDDKPKTAPKKHTTEAPKPKADIAAYIKDCIKNIGQTDYFYKRGLNAETIKKYCLGYDAKEKAVVIPYSSKLNYYQRRKVSDKSFYKPRTEDAGPEPVFNLNALYGKDEAVFVVESPICALSIMQCGGAAISTCGTNGINKLVTELRCKKTKNTLIICMDNDEPGVKACEALCAELHEFNIKYIPYNVAGNCKDPNDLLAQNPSALAVNISAAQVAARNKYRTDKDSFSAYDLQKKKIEPPKWLVEKMLSEGVAFLCAPSKIGKSWMVLQMCLSITEGKDFLCFSTNKTGCLYLALEDSEFRLQSRMNKLLGSQTAPRNLHISLYSDKLNSGLLEQIQKELDYHKNIGLVAIDTFQMIRGKAMRKNDVYGNDYDELGLLKEFAKRNKICLLLVHHLRKMSDDADVFNRISGSVGLMGVADATFVISKKNRGDDQATLHMTGRDIVRNEYIIEFDKDKCIWELVGNAEEQEEKRKQREYETEPLVMTIKGILKANPYGWTGSVSDLILASSDITGQCMDGSPTQIGIKLAAIRYKLYNDGIDYKQQGSRANGRKYNFFYKNKRNYQPNFLDKDDESDT